MATAVMAEGVRKRFGSTQALDGFDLEVPAGTVCGLLGPNGAGKTTAVRILATLLRPDAGRAEVAGLRRRRRRRARSAPGSGSPASTPRSTRCSPAARTSCCSAGCYHLVARAARRRADELLEQFGLADAADRPAKQYSGGMRRRLDLAASLIPRPRVLFLDEPTTGLDPRSRNEVWDAVRALVAGGTTVLLTTQYLDEADQLADQISVIDPGRVIADGTPDELKAPARRRPDRPRGARRRGPRRPPPAIVGRVAGADAEVDRDRRRRQRAGARPRRRADASCSRRSTPPASRRRTSRCAAHAGRGFLRLHRASAPRRWRHDFALRPRRSPAGRLRWAHRSTPGPSPAATSCTGSPSRAILAELGFSVLLLLLFGYVFGSGMQVPGGGDYHRVPDAGPVRAVHRVRHRRDDAGGRRRRREGRHRPLPLHADRVVGRRARALHRRHAQLAGRASPWCSDGVSPSAGSGTGAAPTRSPPSGCSCWLRFAFLWVGIYLGLVSPNVESVERAVDAAVPDHDAPSAFVAPELMPDWLGSLAEWNPLSSTVTATRELFGSPGVTGDGRRWSGTRSRSRCCGRS